MLPFLVAAIGVVVILGTAQEVFRDLFHPARSGALSDYLARAVFSLFRRYPKLLPFAGPAALAFVIAAWIALFAFGFALIYWAGYPEEFRTSTDQVPDAARRFITSVYLSLEVLVTLGFGDIIPKSTLMRLLTTTESLIGFGLLTASVSWIVLLYPALARMRLLARGVAVLVDAEQATGVAIPDTESDVMLSSLARDTVRTRIDLMHFPIVYYFAASDQRAAVPKWLPHLSRFAADGVHPHQPKRVRVAAAALGRALDDLAEILSERFLTADARDRDAVFREYAEHHRVA